MIDEIRNKLDFIPDVIFCSVGGGGLLGGVIHGCAAGWDHGAQSCGYVSLDLIMNAVPIVVIEPLGSNCFYSSMALNSAWKEIYELEDIKGVATDMDIVKKGRGLRIAHLRKLETRATSLGATSPAPKVVDKAIVRIGEVICVCVPDEMIMSAAISFAGKVTPLSRIQCDC